MEGIPTYEPLSLSKILGWTKVQLPRRVFVDIEVGVIVKALDLVDPGFSFPSLKMDEGLLVEVEVMIRASTTRQQHALATLLSPGKSDITPAQIGLVLFLVSESGH